MSQKRSAEEGEEPPCRYTRIRLASPSPERSVSSGRPETSSPFHNIEYEVIDTELKKCYVSDDTDEEDSHAEGNKIFSEVRCDDLDNALLGDTSEENPTSPTSNSDVDPGLPRCDYLDFEECLLCGTKDKDISYQYCSTCFAERKSLFPSRPRRHKKKMKKNSAHSHSTGLEFSDNQNSSLESIKLENNCTGEEHSKGENAFSEDNETGGNTGGPQPQLSENVGSFCLTEQVVKSQSSGSKNTTYVDKDNQLPENVVEGPSTDHSPASPSTPSTSALNSPKLTLDKCRVCFIKPENGLFIHTNIAHVYGCYKCAKKIWFYNGGCPICRRKIFKVAKLFV